MFRKQCCKHLVTLTTLILMILLTLFFFSTEYRNSESETAVAQEAPVPVYDFWHPRHKMYRFHLLPPWSGDEIRNIQFYAYANKQPATEPVYQFWNPKKHKETFHFLPAQD